MPSIVVSQPHHKTPEEIRAMVDNLIDKLQSRYNVEATWHGDHRVTLSGPGARGSIELGAHVVNVEIILSRLLAMMEKPIRKQVISAIQKYLA
ncbi:MAG: polyhydroxyalkanoic acid system family protein [Spongiibacteraceae bacterium]